MGQSRRGKSTIILYLLGYLLQFQVIKDDTTELSQALHVLLEAVAEEH